MTTKAKVEKFILKHPAATNTEVAAACDTTTATAKQYRLDMRKAGKIPKLQKGWNRKKVEPKVKKDPAVILSPAEEIKDRLRDLLKSKKSYSIPDLADYFNIGPSNIRTALDLLKEEGINIVVKETGEASISSVIAKSDARVLDIKKMTTGMHKFGAIGDNHLGSKYERLDVLNALYDIYEKEGITVVYNTGNWIDGEARFNVHDLHTHGLDGQIDYMIKKYPQRKGITTFFVSGDDHEGWYTQREGMDVGRYLQIQAERAGRKDLQFLGHMEADIVLKAKNGKTTVRVQHPGGGSAYAISYTAQKIVESYTGGEKPDVLLIGHYHKAEYSYIRGVHVVQTGCTQDQTPFMRKKRLAAHLGGWIIEIGTDDVGAVTRFKQEWIPFYDNAYYEKWKFMWNKKTA
jgi:predicted phosphodiesterase/ribosomal protein S25